MESASINNDILRYSRQIILEGFGKDGQEKLRKSKVLVVGAGGLGSPVLLYLAAAGIGNIGIVDFDSVTVSNLNRQVIHFTDDIGSRKTDSAEKKIKRLNPEINVIKHNTRLNIDNAEEIIEGYDVVVDATDNFTARYIVSDCCFFLKKCLVEGAAVGYEGILMTIIPGKTPCYRCLYPKPPEDGALPACNDTGILGAITGVIGSLQTIEVIKLLTGLGEPATGKLLIYDLMSAGFREIKWKKRDDCPLCGKEPVIKELDQYNIKCRLKEI